MDLDNIKNELLSMADTGLKYGLNKAPNADIELYVTQEKTVEVKFQGGAVNARDSVLSGVGVRVFENKRKSFSCSSGYEIENIKSAVDEAIKITEKISHTDERYKQLAEPLSPANEGIIDPEVLLITSETLTKEGLLMVEGCKKVDNRLVSISGERSIIAAAFAITNSQEIAAATRITANVGVVSVVAKEGNKQKTGFNFCVSRSKDLNIDLRDIGIKSANDALKLLKSKPMNSSEQISVVFEPMPAAMYLGTAFGSSTTGKAVTEGKSYFADKIGDEIAIKKMTVFDDGTLPEGLATSAIDGEGIPSQKTPIVENSVLKSFINDSY
ncbi:MAG: hypothetical protein HeimC3_54430 [Candidatus Heimdallarchaeota archaeon LC_3]|nr:MAG: hypothetical protein HeimC3_54430 [Candidatus Heimdallarchaeota archaeon LC_3]